MYKLAASQVRDAADGLLQGLPASARARLNFAGSFVHKTRAAQRGTVRASMITDIVNKNRGPCLGAPRIKFMHWGLFRGP